MVNAWFGAALKWLGERIGHALGAILHEVIAFLMGMVNAMHALENTAMAMAIATAA